MNNKQAEAKLREVARISEYDEVLVKDLVECVQDIHRRLKIVEERHNDRVDAMTDADEAMEEAEELDHQY
jgi:hypothetical protein